MDGGKDVSQPSGQDWEDQAERQSACAEERGSEGICLSHPGPSDTFAAVYCVYLLFTLGVWLC